jgi:hypothetical protein
MGWAGQVSGRQQRPHRSARAYSRLWAAEGRGLNDFSVIFLQITVLIVFVQFFGQISNSFSVQIIPTKNLI